MRRTVLGRGSWPVCIRWGGCIDKNGAGCDIPANRFWREDRTPLRHQVSRTLVVSGQFAFAYRRGEGPPEPLGFLALTTDEVIHPHQVWEWLTPSQRKNASPEMRAELIAPIVARQKAREAKLARRAEREWQAAEYEAWIEYAERERAAKLARAIARLRVRK